MAATSPKVYAINYASEDTALNNTAFVRMLYRNILNRTADEDGLNYWTNLLNDHKISREALISDFFESTELQSQFGNIADAVTSVYRSLLLREPDKGGLDFYTRKISLGEIDLAGVVASILDSSEFSDQQNYSAEIPIVSVLWQDAASWDSITAEQVAQLIAYNPNGDGKTYPNANLQFIVSGYGPQSSAIYSAPSHTYEDSSGVTHSLAQTVYTNTPEQTSPDGLAKFITAISDRVYNLTKDSGAPIYWATEGGMGSVSYHPDTSTQFTYTDPVTKITTENEDYSTDWAGYTIPGTSETFPIKTDVEHAYQAFIDYTLFLNNTLTGYKTSSGQTLNGLKTLVYETENSYMPTPTSGSGENALYELILDYKGSQAVLPQDWSAWHDATGKSGLLFSATGGSTTNWLNTGPDQWLAQIYDLYTSAAPSNDPNNDTYPFTVWNSPQNIDPSLNKATDVANDFAHFFANTQLQVPGASDLAKNQFWNVHKTLNFAHFLANIQLQVPGASDLAKDQFWNVRNMLNTAIDPTGHTIPQSYNDDAVFVFSYGPGKPGSTDPNNRKTADETVNQPIFQYGLYGFTNDSSHNFVPSPLNATPATYYWSSSQFAEFASNFGPELSSKLNTINATFPVSAQPKIGVWGGERALDAWFNFADLPAPPSHKFISDVQAICSGEKVSLNEFIDNIYQSLIGRIPTTAETDTLTAIATSIHNPATQDNVTQTAAAAMVNYIANTSSVELKSLSDASFVEHLYWEILGRSSDELGAQYHLTAIQNGTTREDVVQNFLNSSEFVSETGFNLQTSTFASYVDVLWQDGPESWTDPKVQATTISQLGTLMEGNPNFTLVLDFDAPFSDAVQKGWAWTPDNLVTFLKGLNTAGLAPKILYHPDGSSDDGPQWFEDQNPANHNNDFITPMAEWMATLNKAIAGSGLPSSYLLSGIVGEGPLLPKVRETYVTFNNDYQQALQLNNLPAQTIELWYTGDWHSDNTLPLQPTDKPEPAIMSGVFVQLYDYWESNSLYKSLEVVNGQPVTDPKNASSIGTQLLSSLLDSTNNNQPITAELLQQPAGTIFTLNFSGSPTGASTDAPIFGDGTGVKSSWDLASTNLMLQALSEEATTLYKQYTSNPPAPQIAIWSIQAALDDLVPVISATPANNNELVM